MRTWSLALVAATTLAWSGAAGAQTLVDPYAGTPEVVQPGPEVVPGPAAPVAPVAPVAPAQPINPYQPGYAYPPPAYPTAPAPVIPAPAQPIHPRPQSLYPAYPQQPVYQPPRVYYRPYDRPVYYRPYSYPPPMGVARPYEHIRRVSLGVHGMVLGLNQQIGKDNVVLGGAGLQLRFR